MTIAFDNANISDNALHDAFTALGHNEARVQKTSGGAFIVRLGELKGPTGPPVGAAPPSERDTLEQGLEQRLGPFRPTNFNPGSEIVFRSIYRYARVYVRVS